MAILTDVKTALRITASAYDTEVQDLIDAAKADLALAGVASSAIVDTDPLIKRAITTYVKAYFGYGNPDADRFILAYELLRNHMAMAGDYVDV